MGLSPSDHVLLFPFPAKGHIKPFLCLAHLLCNAGFRVTFLNTDHHHRNIHDLTRLAAQLPSLHFHSISDGLPTDQPQNLLDGKLFKSMPQVTKFLFRDLLLSYNNGTSPITCVITDVILRFPMDVAQQLGIPVFCFSTFSARFLFLYFSIPKLLEDGQIPYPEGNSNQQLHGIPGGEGLLRCKDLPGFWSVENVAKSNPMNFVNQTLATSKSCGLILNTFDELEAPFVTRWNSTLESLTAGIPMISWPHIGDQPSNATWLTKVWKIGVQIEDSYDRSTVETMVRSIMEHQDEKMESTIAELAKQAKDRVSKHGTSYLNLQCLIEDIKEIKLN
ncbi:unnamed protein product [Citrullus colocynthis]|uniref:Uncharacterized protein n=1 Tax=Citrullus colocynthis TaxID=252529 RepID=A0ABP0YHD9_9ROSI